jgi:hypothetical protein
VAISPAAAVVEEGPITVAPVAGAQAWVAPETLAAQADAMLGWQVEQAGQARMPVLASFVALVAPAEPRVRLAARVRSAPAAVAAVAAALLGVQSGARVDQVVFSEAGEVVAAAVTFVSALPGAHHSTMEAAAVVVAVPAIPDK